MKGWPKNDANWILYIEVILMGLFLTMNAADYQLQQLGAAHYTQAGSFPVSQFITPVFDGLSASTVILIERTAWWLHIGGILVLPKLSLLFQASAYFIGISQYVLWEFET